MSQFTKPDDINPDIKADIKPTIGALHLCVWTGTEWKDYGLSFEFVLATMKQQHEALDSLLAKNVMRDPMYMPSKQPEWAAVVQGNTVIKMLTDLFLRPIG